MFPQKLIVGIRLSLNAGARERWALWPVFRRPALLGALAAVLVQVYPAQAELVYSESFDYGSVGGKLEGKNGGTGFSGGWEYPGMDYIAAGLSFGNVLSTGGAAAANSENTEQSRRLLGENLGEGTYYGMFLTQAGSANNLSEFTLKDEYLVGPAMQTPTSNAAIYDGWGSSGSALTVGETYLVLFEMNVAEPMSLDSTNSVWVLSLGQYNTLSLDGSITKTELNAPTVGTANNQVSGRLTGEFYIFTDIVSIDLLLNSTNKMDEFRLSDTSFDEAIAAVPEPTTWTLLALGAVALASSRRRQRGGEAG